MIYLAAAVLLSVTIVILFKYFLHFQINNLLAITTNYAVALTMSLLFFSEKAPLIQVVHKPWLAFAMITGICFIITFNTFAASSQRTGVAITAVSSKMSVIIPVLMSVLLFQGEYINLMKIIGLMMVFVSFYLIFKKQSDEHFDKKYIFLPILLFFANGTNDTLMKYSQYTFLRNSHEIYIYLAVVFSTALTLGVILCAILFILKKLRIDFKSIAAGIVLGVLNWGSTFFFFKAVGQFNASVFFPVFNVSIVALTAIFGLFIFRERLSSVNKAGLILAAISILIIAIA